MRTHVLFFIAVSAAAALGCSSKSDNGGGGGAGTLTLSPVTWNPSNASVGNVQAVADFEQTVAVFGAAGVTTFVGGAVLSTDATVTHWQSAAAIPSADDLGSWIVGVDGSGRVYRVRTQDTVEDVSDRYGLAQAQVTQIAGGNAVTVFLLNGGAAVSDGKTVTRYDAATLEGAAASGDRAAIAVPEGVRIFEKGAETDVALPDATSVAFDDQGNLFATTHHAVFELTNGAMQQVFDGGARTIHALTASGANVWFTLDSDMALLQNGQVSITSGATFPPDAHLASSPSGDVWIVAGGQLQRYAAQAAGASDQSVWTSTVQPVYATICSNCHSADTYKDKSGVDLSTYAMWDQHRADVYKRVVTNAGTPSQMPPPTSGFTLTDDQRAAIEAWSKPK